MSWMAILSGVVSYLVLWLLWSVLSPSYEHQSLHSYDLFMLVFFWLMPVISGFLAGQLKSQAAKINATVHGLSVGIVIAAISLAAWFKLDIMEAKLMFNLGGFILLATIGGGISQLLQKWRSKNGKNASPS